MSRDRSQPNSTEAHSLLNLEGQTCSCTELHQVTGTGVTSGRETLLPSFVRCFGIPLEPQLSLCMDFIAVRLHSGESIHRHILTNKKAL